LPIRKKEIKKSFTITKRASWILSVLFVIAQIKKPVIAL
jgi:hypothetical protein